MEIGEQKYFIKGMLWLLLPFAAIAMLWHELWRNDEEKYHEREGKKWKKRSK